MKVYRANFLLLLLVSGRENPRVAKTDRLIEVILTSAFGCSGKMVTERAIRAPRAKLTVVKKPKTC